MASAAKRPRLNATRIEELPEDVMVKIFRLLPMKTRVESSLVCKRWRQHMPYASEKFVLKVAKLPFNRLFIGDDNVVAHSAVTDALRSLLPQPQVGPKLIGISFASVNRRWEISNSQLELITRHCPQLSQLSFGQVQCGFDQDDADGEEISVDPCEVLQRLQQLSNLSSLTLPNFTHNVRATDPTALSRFLLDLSSLLAYLPLKILSLKGFSVFPSLICPNLTELRLTNCTLSDLQMSQLCQTAVNLTSLLIAGGTKVDLQPIAKLVNLVKLAISSPLLTETELERICANCKKLNNLAFNASLTNISCLQFLPELSDLGVPLDDDLVANLPHNWQLSKLKSLVAVKRDDFTDTGLIGLCNKLPQLNSLSVSSPNITDASMLAVASNLTHLSHLSLNHTGIGDKSVALLGQSQLLETLNISHTAKVTAEGFWHLIVKRKGTQMRTRLRVTVETGHSVWNSQLVEELKAELNSVNVTLTI